MGQFRRGKPWSGADRPKICDAFNPLSVSRPLARNPQNLGSTAFRTILPAVSGSILLISIPKKTEHSLAQETLFLSSAERLAAHDHNRKAGAHYTTRRHKDFLDSGGSWNCCLMAKQGDVLTWIAIIRWVLTGVPKISRLNYFPG